MADNCAAFRVAAVSQRLTFASEPYVAMRILNIHSLLFAMGIAVWLSAFAPSAQAAEQDSRAGVPRQSLVHDGVKRSYVLRLPGESVLRSGQVPLVLVLHGGGGNAEHAERMTGFTEKAQKEGFIVAYPEGSGRLRDKLLTWNAGHCCGYAMEQGVDDVGFVGALIDNLIRNYPIDHRRVYVTGMSNGGMMAHRLGRELSGRIAAIAPVVATVFGDEKRPAQPVSALMLNGMLDKSVPHEGGPPGGRFNSAWDGTPTKPALDQGTFWAGANGCAQNPRREERGAVLRWHYACPAGGAVELYLLKDGGHAWPGGQQGNARGDLPSASLNATDLIWDFFKTQVKGAVS